MFFNIISAQQQKLGSNISTVKEMVQHLIDDSLRNFDLDKSGTLDIAQFQMFLRNHENVIGSLDRVFQDCFWSPSQVKNAPGSPKRSPDLRISPSPKLDFEEDKVAQRKSSLTHNAVSSLSSISMTTVLSKANPIHSWKSTGPALEENLLSSERNSDFLSQDRYVCSSCKYQIYSDWQPSVQAIRDETGYAHFTIYNVCNTQGVKPIRFCPFCGAPIAPKPMTRIESLTLMQDFVDVAMSPMAHEEITDIVHQGHLYKPGRRSKRFVQRYFILRGQFLYQFKKEKDSIPSETVFLQGYFVEALQDSKHYGLRLVPPDGFAEMKTRCLYSHDFADIQKWIKSLRQAANTQDINQHYDIGKQIGMGHFSCVYEATAKDTGLKYAVKVLDKDKMDEEERRAWKTETGIMRICSHPCIMDLIDMYEDKKSLYMVMPLMKSGDLYDRMKLRRHLDELTCKKILWKILDCCSYLHAIGVVHRDLKPENILLASDLDDSDVRLTDFGLSKFFTPKELMNDPCGTVAYVAPEVLQQKGYGKTVDVWSIGIMMHFILVSYLPFDAQDPDRLRRNEKIIKQVLELEVRTDQNWWDNISKEAKSLLNRFLDKNPSTRITIDEAMNDVWFDEIREEVKKTTKVFNPPSPGCSPPMSPKHFSAESPQLFNFLRTDI